MEWSEHELTQALHGAARSVLAAQRKDVRKGKVDVETAWEELGRYERFTLVNSVGDQILRALVALPDVEVPPGTRPEFTDAQVLAAVEETLGEEGGRMRRKVLLATRVALLRTALQSVPPRSDPTKLDVPDHL